MKILIKNFVLVLLVFLAVSAFFSLLEISEEIEEISISQLANDINQEVVKDITVSGEKIEIIYQDDTKAVTRKETESSLSESLINYGVTQEFLGKTEIHIKEVGGIWIWLNPLFF